MQKKKSLQEEINDFLVLWGGDAMSAFLLDLIPLFHLYNVDEEDDWLKDAVGKEDLQNVRLIRTVYLMSRLAEFHGNRISSTNTNFKNLWKRLEESSLNEN